MMHPDAELNLGVLHYPTAWASSVSYDSGPFPGSFRSVWIGAERVEWRTGPAVNTTAAHTVVYSAAK